MVIRKESVSKRTGETKVHYTSDREGYKVVMREGEPVEIKMSQEERKNRKFGNPETGKHGQRNGKQNGVSKVNATFNKQYRDEKINKGEGGDLLSTFQESPVDITKKAKKVEDLTAKLKRAKMDYQSAVLDNKIQDFEKKEKYYKNAEKYVLQDKKRLKEKNDYYMDIEVKPKKRKGSIVVGYNSDNSDGGSEGVGEELKEGFTFDEKLERISKLSETIYGETEKNNIDVLERISYKLKEAPEDEEETEDTESGEEDITTTPEDDGEDEPVDTDTEEDPGEEGDNLDDPAPEPEEDAIPSEDNEVYILTKVNEFDVDQNNVYDYYDFILDKLSDQTAIDAINAEYAAIEDTRRKVTPARELYNRVVKRVELMNKTEAENLTKELSGDEIGGEEEAESDLTI